MTNPTANIDGDIIAYSVASACEGKRYLYKGEEFESKTQLNKILKDDGVDDSAITVTLNPEPWEFVRDSLVKYTEGIIESLADLDPIIHLTGKSNFRYEVATIQPYKGNRSSISRPHHLDGCRQFLVDAYSAKVSTGMEADDTIGLAHQVGRDTIATIDKDLDSIPGKHFNWIKNIFYEVTELEADANFYCQVITGDSTDNIPGLYGLGARAKVLETIRGLGTEEEMFSTVAKEYECRFGSYWKQFMRENCTLLWILQQREPKWIYRLEKET